VQTLASRVGLTANVSVPSNDKVGLIYKTDTARITEQDTLMNVLTRLAQRSGCIFWINGTVLNFVPATAVTGPNYQINYIRPTPASIASGNFVTLRTQRSYRLAKNIKVRTKSWQMKPKQVISSEFNMLGSVGGNLVHEYKAPNLTKQQADAFTQQRLNEISSREKTVEISLPGDINLTPENPVVLTGTGTAFDQTYIVSRIGHSFSQQGYRMNVSVRNKDKSRNATQSATAGTGETTAP
jgi:phage protein D